MKKLIILISIILIVLGCSKPNDSRGARVAGVEFHWQKITSPETGIKEFNNFIENENDKPVKVSVTCLKKIQHFIMPDSWQKQYLFTIVLAPNEKREYDTHFLADRYERRYEIRIYFDNELIEMASI